MSEGRVRKSGAKVLWTPIISFAVLGALILGAVVFGNLVVDRADGCRSVGSDSQAGSSDDATTLLVYSDRHDALMLCDVPQETVEYDPPERDRTVVWLEDSSSYLEPVYADKTHYEGILRIKGSDLTRDAALFPSEENFSYDGDFDAVPVYVKGEFSSLEDCGDFGENSYESDDLDGFDGSDMFHPDRIQSCWTEIESEVIGG